MWKDAIDDAIQLENNMGVRELLEGCSRHMKSVMDVCRRDIADRDSFPSPLCHILGWLKSFSDAERSGLSREIFASQPRVTEFEWTKGFYVLLDNHAGFGELFYINADGHVCFRPELDDELIRAIVRYVDENYTPRVSI